MIVTHCGYETQNLVKFIKTCFENTISQFHNYNRIRVLKIQF